MKTLVIVSVVLIVASVCIIGTNQILKSIQQANAENACFYTAKRDGTQQQFGYQDQNQAKQLDQLYKIKRWWNPYHPQLDAILTTDKPIYQPTDVLFANVELFYSLNKTSIFGERRLDLRLIILDAQGIEKYSEYQNDCLLDATSVFSVNLSQIKELESGGNFELVIDQNPSSQYFINALQFPSARRKFRIYQYTTQQYSIKFQLDNYGTKSSYNPGDKVIGYGRIYRSDGTASTDFSSFTGSIFSTSLDISQREGPKVKLSSNGEAFFSFIIPVESQINVATVYLKITDLNTQGWHQTASEDISIVLQTDEIQMIFEPQSGLVMTSQNLEQTFYFEFYNKKTNNAVDMKDIKIYEKCGSNIGYDREGSKALNEYHDLYKGTDTFLKSISTSH